MSTPSSGPSNPYAAPKAVVRDIAEPHSGELAARGTRLMAFIVDTLIAVAIAIPALITVGFNMRHGRGTALAAQSLMGLGTVLTLIGLVVVLVLTIYFVRTNGQSIGKRMLGIKVVRKDGSPASLGRIFWLRNFVSGIPASISYLSIGSLYQLVDALMIFTESRQCLHDRIADTMVIKA